MKSFMFSKLRNQIIVVLKNEDFELSQLFNKGIFFLPELAITYLLSKSIVYNAQDIFDGEVEDWEMNRRIDEMQDRPDIIIKLKNDKVIIFEIKIRSHADKFGNDIYKLANKNSNDYIKFFCGIMDSYAGKENKTIKEQNSKINPDFIIEQSFDHFETKDDNYKSKKMSCIVGLWQVS